MPITSADLEYYLSGGGSNTDPNLSLGGAISTTAVVDNTLHNLFDLVSSAEASAGDTEYRCIYVKNNHATLTLLNSIFYILSQSTSPDTSVEIGLGTSGLNGTEQTVVDESTAPTGVTFTALVGDTNSLSIGDMAPTEFYPVWIKRVVNAGAAAFNSDTSTFDLKGDTGA